MMNKAIISAIVLVVVFLVGFVPQYAKVNRLDAELRQALLENTAAELRNLVGLVYVQANQKNYGIAAGTTARFFNRVREVANQTPDANAKKAYEDPRAGHGCNGNCGVYRSRHPNGPGGVPQVRSHGARDPVGPWGLLRPRLQCGVPASA